MLCPGIPSAGAQGAHLPEGPERCGSVVDWQVYGGCSLRCSEPPFSLLILDHRCSESTDHDKTQGLS